MTCHVAISAPGFAILLSDSQSSTERFESHGYQKQFAGPDFLVGAAGNLSILIDLFDALHAARSQTPPLTALNIVAWIEDHLRNSVRDAVRSEIQIIVATPDSGGQSFQAFHPGTFLRSGRRSDFECLGSGAELVERARARDQQLGVQTPPLSLASALALAQQYLEAANESLTVDDLFLAGVIVNERTYQFGHLAIEPGYMPDALGREWGSAFNYFESIEETVRAINGEIHHAQVILSPLQVGQLSSVALTDLAATNQLVAEHLQTLDQLLTAYFVWYDQILGR